jgi:hypothetical protein
MPRGAVDEPHGGQGCYRFTATALTDDSQGFTWIQIERYVANGLNQPVTGVKVYLQTVNGKNGIMVISTGRHLIFSLNGLDVHGIGMKIWTER